MSLLDPLETASSIKGEFLPFARDVRGFLHANGWVACPKDETAEIAIEILTDGKLFAVVRADKALPLTDQRPFAAKAFRVVVPPNFAVGKATEFVAVAHSKGRSVEIGRRQFRNGPIGELIAESSLAVASAPNKRASELNDSSIAAIVLTQDGDALLEGLLSSICAFEQDTFRRIVVVDHESSDATAELIRSFQPRLPIQVLPASRESSFASSNNSGANLCDEDILVFLNNDIVFAAPAIRTLTSHLGPEVGLVGMKLTDAPAGRPGEAKLASQDVGIHFRPTEKDLWPFESRWLSDLPVANNSTVEVPAVTAALAAIESRVFHMLGRFDERYFYGWEDIDLSMKSLASGRKNISVNSISAIHLRGQTRHKVSQSQAPRRGKNPEIFAATWDDFVRRAVVRDQFDRVGFWTGRKANIGIVLPDHSKTSDLQAASAIAREIAELLSVRVFLYESGAAIDCSDLDALLIVGPPPASEELRGLAATAWVAALLEGVESPTAGPVSDAVDIWLGPRQTADVAPGQVARAFLDELKQRSKSWSPASRIRL